MVWEVFKLLLFVSGFSAGLLALLIVAYELIAGKL
jgi:hypothetical protein